MRSFTVFLIFLLILTACAAPAQPTVPPAATEEPASQAVTLDGTLDTSLIVAEWGYGPEGNLLFPIDPASGTALAGYKPISLGDSSFHAFSPNRQTLAAVSFPNDHTYAQDNSSLLLIDLPEWKTRRVELEVVGWASAMVFSPDGKRLAIAHGDFNYGLTVVDVTKGSIIAQAETDSIVSRLKFAQNGEALMLYSPVITATDGLNTDPPQVRLLDAADLRPLWSTELEEVRDGAFPKDETVTQIQFHEPGKALYLSPGLVFAPDRDALYVVHADSDRLTTVDFGAQEVKTVKIRPKLSWFERLLSLTAGVAHAKIADGTNKQAVISPDGRFLYVVGVSNTSFQDQQENVQTEATPLGLEIVRASDGSRVGHVETDAAELSLSPDGRFLYLRVWGDGITAPWTEIYDTTSRQLVAHKEKLFATPAWLMNGEFLLVSTYVSPAVKYREEYHMSVLQPSDLSVVADWTGYKFIDWLTAP